MEIKDYKRGWYKKGCTYRFLAAISQEGRLTFLLYQKKSERLKGSNQVTGLNIEFDDWFPKAEYIGLELEESTC